MLSTVGRTELADVAHGIAVQLEAGADDLEVVCGALEQAEALVLALEGRVRQLVDGDQEVH